MEVSYNGEYFLNKKPEATDYNRYECDFCHTEKKPSIIKITSAKHKLKLDFYNNNFSDMRCSD